MWRRQTKMHEVTFRGIFFQILTVTAVRLFRRKEAIQSTVAPQRSVAQLILCRWRCVFLAWASFTHEYLFSLVVLTAINYCAFGAARGTFQLRGSQFFFSTPNHGQKKVRPAHLLWRNCFWNFQILLFFRLAVSETCTKTPTTDNNIGVPPQICDTCHNFGGAPCFCDCSHSP